jgi:4-diphosphocytidyl-2-C-methyl-D-erythritol kinase
MKIISPAKINLTLDIFQPDNSGYHPIQSIFQRISLSDTIVINKQQSPTLTFSCNNKQLQSEETTIHKAYKLLCKYLDTNLGIHIKLTKNIPMQSGLGGGSSNAASFLVGANKLFELNLTKETLLDITKKIGMDVPFFITETPTAIGTGYGEKISPCTSLQQYDVLICMTNTSISTPEAYQAIDNYEIGKNIEATQKLQKTLQQDTYKLKDIEALIHNDFELYLWDKHMQLTAARDTIANICNIPTQQVHISGSGGALFILFEPGSSDLITTKAQMLRNQSIWAIGGRCL